MFKRALGTRDILPDEVLFWQKIEETGRRVFSVYNYKEIRTPLIETVSLFDRSLGQTTEVVQKQMFLIPPLSSVKTQDEAEKDTYVLRPEGTAPIVRAYIENHMDKGLAKLYYVGPMFRRERPQKGRLRQFHHLGCEVIGSEEASVDIEVISLVDRLLKELSVSGYKIKINSLGCLKDKKELSELLKRKLTDKLSLLCQDCNRRFAANILRILDCKNEACRRVVEELDIKDSHLCGDCKAHFSRVRQGLDSLGIAYEVEPQLVRGLDYYTRTVFEVIHSQLGAQDALGAGGRYDNLVGDLGGTGAGAMGFAFGMERLMLVSGIKPVASSSLVYVITLGQEAKNRGLGLLADLRKCGIPSDTDYENKSLKGAMRKANDSGARFVAIVGEEEIKKDAVTLKDMESGEQDMVPCPGLVKYLSDRIK